MRTLIPSPRGLVPAVRSPIRTPRLVVEPISLDQVASLVAGDFSGVVPGEGWPVPESVPGSPPWRLSLQLGVDINWVVTLDGLAIGDCFTHGGADEAGDIEIGYALAEPYRRRGYGTELVAAFSEWLLEHEGVERVVARNIEAGNVGSRRVLERAGFALESDRGDVVAYALGRAKPVVEGRPGAEH